MSQRHHAFSKPSHSLRCSSDVRGRSVNDILPSIIRDCLRAVVLLLSAILSYFARDIVFQKNLGHLFLKATLDGLEFLFNVFSAAKSESSVVECPGNGSPLGHGMVIIKIQVAVCVCWFPVDTKVKGSIGVLEDMKIKERNTLVLLNFTGKLN